MKLDGCGSQLNLELYDELINATGKAITMEVRMGKTLRATSDLIMINITSERNANPI